MGYHPKQQFSRFDRYYCYCYCYCPSIQLYVMYHVNHELPLSHHEMEEDEEYYMEYQWLLYSMVVDQMY